MTLFAAADAQPWMVQDYPRIPGWLADLLVAPRKDPVLRQAWIEHAEHDRDQHVRMWLLQDLPVAGGPSLYIAHRQTTPAAAWAWYRAVAHAPGHRVVLVDLAAPDRADNPQDTTAEVKP